MEELCPCHYTSQVHPVYSAVVATIVRSTKFSSTPGPVGTGMDDRIWFNSSCGLTNYPGQLRLAMTLWVGSMSTGQRAVMLCGWGVKAGMAPVWWQLKLCEPL